jgi:O-antigen/teichoic acid export membrane protein
MAFVNKQNVFTGVWKVRLVGVAHLLSGNYLNVGFVLISIVIAARALGPTDYGVMVMVMAYCRLVGRIMRFESWQPLIKYAAGIDDDKSSQYKAQLYAFGLVLDVGASLLAAATAVLLGAAWVQFLGQDPETLQLIAIYAVAIAFSVTGMPTAVFRIAGKFKTIAYTNLFGAIIRIPLAAAAYYAGAGITEFMVIWAATEVLSSLLFIGLAFRQLRRERIPSLFRARLKGVLTRFPGILGFAWTTNLSMTLRTMTQEMDVLIVGALTDSASAGLYHIAKRIAKAARQVAAQVQTVLYPDLARDWAQSDFRAFSAAVLQTQIGLASVGLAAFGALYLTGEWLIRIGPGEAYQGAFPLLMVQMVAILLVMHAAPARSALLAMGRPRVELLNAALSTAAFFAVAFLAIPVWGAMGANFAHIALGLVSAVILDILWITSFRRRRAASVDAA